MGKEITVLTNITLQTFASDGGAAPLAQCWEQEGPAFFKRLFAAGHSSYKKRSGLE